MKNIFFNFLMEVKERCEKGNLTSVTEVAQKHDIHPWMQSTHMNGRFYKTSQGKGKVGWLWEGDITDDVLNELEKNMAIFNIEKRESFKSSKSTLTGLY